MSSYRKRNNYRRKSAFWEGFIPILPLAGVLAFVPLVVWGVYYDTGLQAYDFYAEYGDFTDFFLYGKMVLFIILSSILACILVARLIVEKKNIRFSKIFLPLGVYALLALLSSLFSKYQPYPWTGSFEQFESVFALLGYVLVAYYGFLFVEKKRDFNILIAALTFSTVIIILIGISQAFFTDFFQTSIGKHLIVPGSLRKILSANGGDWENAVSWTFPKGMVYLTLYNPNYVSFYSTLLSPVYLMLIFASSHIVNRIMYGLIYAGLLTVLFGSSSRSGFIAIFFSLLLLLILYARKSLFFWLPVVAIGAVSAGVLIFFLISTQSSVLNQAGFGLLDRFKNAFDMQETTHELTNIQTSKDSVLMTYRNNDLQIIFEPSTVSFGFYDGNDAPVTFDTDYENARITLTDERFAGITIQPVYISRDNTLIGFQVYCEREWIFTNYNNNYYYRTPYNRLVEYSTFGDTWKPLENYGKFFNGRGFIWARTIPLLKSNIILGSGPDTFILEFPNGDFLSMAQNGYYALQITKPHCMYLQVAIQTGLLSLIAMIAFYLNYLIICLITIRRMKKHSFYSLLSGGIAAGTFGYMICALANDSSITVAPLFWTLIGIGLSACFIARRENESAPQS